MFVVEAAGAVQPLTLGVPGAGEQLGGLALRQGLDAVLGAARGVAGVATKPKIPAVRKNILSHFFEHFDNGIYFY